MGKGSETREKILSLAEAAVLSKGYSATSIDELNAAAGITKSGFFYHFKDKADLAKHMLIRFLERDGQIFSELLAEADAETDDPLDAYLNMLEALAKTLGDMEAAHPGCLVAAYCYQHQLFNSEIKGLYTQGVMNWRQLFRARLDAIVEKYPTPDGVDMTVLADATNTVVEGGIVMSMAMADKTILPQQILLHRDYVRRLFRPQ